MHTGPKLGKALKSAMTKKGVNQFEVAAQFDVKQPSVSEWIKYGRISKRHIPMLVAYFRDQVGPEHWGLPVDWGSTTNASDLKPEELQLVEWFRELLPEDRDAAIAPLKHKAEEAIKYKLYFQSRVGTKDVVPDEELEHLSAKSKTKGGKGHEKAPSSDSTHATGRGR